MLSHTPRFKHLACTAAEHLYHGEGFDLGKKVTIHWEGYSMIENLKGIHETVTYKQNTNLRLYLNNESEDYPVHWHTPMEIIMPVKGSYNIGLGDHTITLQEGELIFICPGVIHSLQAPEYGERIIFQIELAVLREIKEINSLLSLIAPAITITPDNAPDIHSRVKQLLFAIRKEYDENSFLSEAAIYARMTDILTIIGRNHTTNNCRFDAGHQKQKEYIDKFLSICSYIEEHCTEDLTLDEAAKIAGFSKYHFTRLFKQFTNTTYYKYLNQKRIAYAESLLADPENSVTEVALLSGFSSLSAFIRMFKMIKQCTPTEFREMYIRP